MAQFATNTNQMIIFGGHSGTGYIATAKRFNTSNSTWLTITATAKPNAREGAAQAWTSSNSVFVWGGSASDTFATIRSNGARYRPSNNTWATVSTTGAPAGRAFPLAAADSSSQVFVFGGLTNASAFTNNVGYLYNDGTNAWSTITTTNAPTSRIGGAVVWSGSEFIVWGGYDGTYANTGARYNPTNSTWSVMNTTNAPSGRTGMIYEWTGSQLFVWGGVSRSGVTFTFHDTGGLYDPTNNTWTAISNALTNTPSARYDTASAFGSNLVVVWGGESLVANNNAYSNDGALYSPVNNTWTTLTATNAPAARGGHTVVRQSATQALIWGGRDGSTALNTGSALTFP